MAPDSRLFESYGIRRHHGCSELLQRAHRLKSPRQFHQNSGQRQIDKDPGLVASSFDESSSSTNRILSPSASSVLGPVNEHQIPSTNESLLHQDLALRRPYLKHKNPTEKVSEGELCRLRNTLVVHLLQSLIFFTISARKLATHLYVIIRYNLSVCDMSDDQKPSSASPQRSHPHRTVESSPLPRIAPSLSCLTSNLSSCDPVKRASSWFSLSSSCKSLLSSCSRKHWLRSRRITVGRICGRWNIVVMVVLFLACLPKDVYGGARERRLLNDLLQSYNILERPVENETEAVKVTFGITLQQIIDVDEKNQLLVSNTWLKLEWKDTNLKWNLSDYQDLVKDLRIPPHRIWKPDVLMYNSADEGFDGTFQTKVVVSHTGDCLYIPPGIFKSTCKIDITWFPFDEQKCKMKFGSWTYSGWQLDLQLSDEGCDLSDFTLNGEWDLVGCPGNRNAIYYQCCPEPYVDVTFEIVIRRRTLYYFCNLILPCVLIASMAVLGFTLPPDCGEKLSLGFTILLSLTVFSNMVNDTMPTTSDAVPLLGTYFNCIMFMVASSVVSTVLILNYHHRSADTHEMSPMVRSMFLQWLPWVLRMHRPGEKITRKTIMMNNKMKELELKERSSKSLLANVLDIDDDFRAHTLPHPGHTNNSTTPGGIIRIPHSGHSVDDSHLVHTCMSQCTRELNLILKELRVITDKLRKDDEELEVRNDWKFAAMVVDRMCLIVFTLFTITATVAVLLSAPHVMVS